MAQMLSDIPARMTLLVGGMMTLLVVPVTLYMGRSMLERTGRVDYVGVTEGTITSSQLVSAPADEEPGLRLKVRYAYKVGGRDYEGSWIRAQFADGGPELGPRFAQGARVPVYYRPLHPQEAILIRGLQGQDLLVLLYLFVLIVMMSLCWVAMARVRRRSRDGLGVYRLRGRLHVPLTLQDLLVWLWVAFAAGGMGLLVIARVTSPSVLLMSWVWGGLLGLCVGARARQRSRQRSGAYELVLDEQRERLRIPALDGRSEPLDLPFSRIHALCIEQDSVQTHEGPRLSWRLVLKYSTRPGFEERAMFAQWAEQKRVVALADWLHRHARLRTEWTGQPLSR